MSRLARSPKLPWFMSFVLLCWFPRYQCSYLPTAPNAKNQAANLESLFDPHSPNVGEEEFSEVQLQEHAYPGL